MKSTWAYKNGKKIMAESMGNDCPKFGFVNGKYAERYGDRLLIKVYANRTQCQKKIEKLKADGIECHISTRHPFTILLDSME